MGKIMTESDMKKLKREAQYEEMTELRRKLLHLVKHTGFNGLCATVIVANAIYIGVETNEMPVPGSEEAAGYYVAEVVFTSFFTCELLLRIFVERGLFFLDGWNGFDSILVSIAFVDAFIIENLPDANMPGGGVFVVLRILRLVRLARIVRLLRFFKELWLLVCGVVAALRPWCGPSSCCALRSTYAASSPRVSSGIRICVMSIQMNTAKIWRDSSAMSRLACIGSLPSPRARAGPMLPVPHGQRARIGLRFSLLCT